MEPFNFILHIDEYLRSIIEQMGGWSYIILFIVVFCETGLVVTPFLPGDSLLFAAGTLAAAGLLDIRLTILTLLVAAIAGDSVNYWAGHKVGPKAFSKKNSKVFNPAYLQKTQDFYDKHGGKTIILARFVPIVRTFAPFVAGVGKMKYQVFITYNIIGAILWVLSITLAGYFFGSIPVIKNNFEIIVFAIIFISILPPIFEYARHKNYRVQRPSIKVINRVFKRENIGDK